MTMAFVISVLTIIGIYLIMVLGLDLQFSYGNLINLGVIAYVAAGAYTYVIVTQAPPTEFDAFRFGFGAPIWFGMIAATIAGLVVGLITAAPVMRMRGEYLALMTFAFAEVFHSILESSRSVTNGLIGLSGVVRPFPSLTAAQQNWVFLGLVLAAVVLVYVVSRRTVSSPFGRVLLAVSDDESGIAAVGKDVTRIRLQTFLLGSAVFGLGGALFVMFVGVATPSIFVPKVTFIAWIALVLGGVRNKYGALLGTAILLGIQEGLRLLSLSPSQSAMVASIRVLVTGALLVILLRVRPPDHVLGTKARIRRSRPPGGDNPELAPSGAAVV